jgi:hypothetical protein
MLGMTRAQAEQAFTASSTRGHANMEFFCLSPNGIRVGYPSARLLRSLPRRDRAAVKGRVVLALTANSHYSVGGVKPGTTLAPIGRGRGTLVRIRIGANTWYLAPRTGVTYVLKVRHGIIEEVGIASSTVSRRGRSFLASFSG